MVQAKPSLEWRRQKAPGFASNQIACLQATAVGWALAAIMF